MDKAPNPVTRLAVEAIELTNGLHFKIVHDLPLDGTFDRIFNRWLRKTKKLNHKSLIDYVKGKKTHCICLTKDQYDMVTKMFDVVPATKEEYDEQEASTGKNQNS